MIKQFYHFDWNATDSTFKQQQNSNYQKLLKLWLEDTDKIFATFDNYFDALILTHHNLASNLLTGGFLLFRKFVKFLSKIILLNIAPRIAQAISNWGEEENKPWSLALFHEDVINR
jgi:hypothetical protein